MPLRPCVKEISEALHMETAAMILDKVGTDSETAEEDVKWIVLLTVVSACCSLVTSDRVEVEESSMEESFKALGWHLPRRF